MSFVDFPAKTWEDILPGAETDEIAFVRGLLVYESGARMTATEVRNVYPYTHALRLKVDFCRP